MSGLERIIRLRGGFHGLGDYIPLFASRYGTRRLNRAERGEPIADAPRFDVTGAAVRDSAPRFPLPPSMVDGPGRDEDAPRPPLKALVERLGSASARLGVVAQALARVSSVAARVGRHAASPHFWRAGLGATKLLGPAAHFVLSMPRPPETASGGRVRAELLVAEAVRLALLVLLAWLKKAFSLVADELGLFQAKFLALLPQTARLEAFPQLRLWSNMVVASSLEGKIPHSLVAEIRRAMSEMHVSSGHGAVRAAKALVWVECLGDAEVPRLIAEIDGLS